MERDNHVLWDICLGVATIVVLRLKATTELRSMIRIPLINHLIQLIDLCILRTIQISRSTLSHHQILLPITFTCLAPRTPPAPPDLRPPPLRHLPVINTQLFESDRLREKQTIRVLLLLALVANVTWLAGGL